MAIEAISSVRSSIYNTISFEGKKHKNKTEVTNPHKSSALKAVPVALLIAMTPMVAQAQNHKTLTPKEATELAQSGKFVNEVKFPGASTLYGDCTIRFLDTDNNPNTAEFAELKFFNILGLSNGMAKATIYPERLVEDSKGFWVQGNGDRILMYSDYKGHDIDEEEKQTRIEIPIEEKFFNVLLAIYGDELPVVRDKNGVVPLSTLK